MIEVKPQNTDSTRTEEELRDKEKYQFLYNAAPVGLFRSRILDGKIFECNEYLAQMFGYSSRDEFISKFIFSDNYVDLEQRKELLAVLYEDGKFEGRFAHLRRKDGQTIWIKFSAIIYPDKGYVEGVASDVTKQYLAEQQVRKYSAAVEQNPATIVITDKKGNIEYVNSKFMELTGYTFNEVLGQNPRILKSGETPPEEYNKMWDTITSGNVWKGEFHNRKKNGELFLESATIGPIKDETGRITHFLAIKEDITQKRETEKALGESERRYHFLFYNMPEGYAYCKILFEGDNPQDFVFNSVNPAFEKLMGLAKVVNKRVSEVIPGIHESNPELLQVFGRVALTGKPERFETYLEPLGFWFSIAAYSPQKEYFVAIFENITERKKKEEEKENSFQLQQNVNNLQRHLLTMMPLDDKLKKITDGIVEYFDADFCRVWIIQPGDLCEKDCVHAKVSEGPHICRNRDLCLHLKVSSGRYTHTNGKVHRRVPFGCYKIGRVASDQEHKFLTNDVQNDPRIHDREWARQLGLMSFAGYQLKASDGATLGVFALFSRHPITALEDAVLEGFSNAVALAIKQNRTAEELYRREATLLGITTSAQDAIVKINSRGEVSFWNPGAERIFGYKESEIIGQNLHKILVPKRYHDVHIKAFSEFVRTGCGGALGKSIELAALHKDGHEFPVDLSLSALKLNGEWHAVGMIRDISERRRAEEMLREKEELLRAITDNAGVVIYMKGIDGRYLFVNQLFEKLFHVTDATIRGKTDCEIFPRVMADAFCKNDKMVIQTRQPLEIEEHAPHDDGDHTYISVKFPLQKNSREIYAVCGISTDITGRKKMEESLKESEEKFRVIVNSALDAIVMTDDSGNITFWNTAAEKIFGYPEADVLGKSIESLLMPKWNEGSLKRLLDKPKGNDRKRDVEFATEIDMVHRDGKSIPVELSVAAIELRGLWHFVTIIRDITEIKRGRIQLVQSEKLAAIGTLAAGVAHEINNPIGYVSSNLNTMGKYLQKVKGFLEKSAPEENEEWSEIKEIMSDSESAIKESLDGVSRVKKIVADLKSFSRVDRAEKEYANINDGIESTLNIVWNELKYRCKVEKQLGQIPELYCLPNQLNQVFLNLLVNAGQAIPGDNGLIIIKTWFDSGNIHISIKDNGTGIPKENMDKIFEAFFTTKEVGKGTGLGLSLAYDIVRKHAGKIEVTSEPGIGTEFVITLPVEGGLSE